MNKQNIITMKKELGEIQQVILWMLLLLGTYLFSSPAFAQTVVGSVLCSVYGLVAFDIGQGLATLAIIALGVGAMLGRVTWGQAVTVIAGIGGTIGALVIMVAVTPVSLIAELNSGLCSAQATIAQTQSGVAAAVWSALSLR